MKKWLMIFSSFVLLNAVVFANNSKRIEELKKEGNALVQQKQQYIETIQKIDIRLIQIQAIIDELKKKDK